MIRETIIITVSTENDVHVAPMGVTVEGDSHIIAPFRPSTTLENLRVNPVAVINYTDDVRVFAGCLTGRRNWPTRPATRVKGAVLEQALAHAEVTVARIEDDDVRPRFHCLVVHAESHAPFRGFNRAQAAVIEAAILVSRLHMLPLEKIKREIAYLEIAVGKTAGPAEKEAWGWLMERIAAFEREAAEGKRA
jgi:hypothetical protein